MLISYIYIKMCVYFIETCVINTTSTQNIIQLLKIQIFYQLNNLIDLLMARENIINYEDEGGGEDDMTAFDITPLQVHSVSFITANIYWNSHLFGSRPCFLIWSESASLCQKWWKKIFYQNYIYNIQFVKKKIGWFKML